MLLVSMSINLRFIYVWLNDLSHIGVGHCDFNETKSSAFDFDFDWQLWVCQDGDKEKKKHDLK